MIRVGHRVQQGKLGHSITSVCEYFDYSRANYYKARKEKANRQVATDEVLQLVHRERALQHRLSGKKIYRLIKGELEARSIKMGRDKFYDLLRQFDLLISPRPRAVRTTDSLHGWRRYTNLMTDRLISGPNQAWVCDLTYIRTLEGFMYLCLIMDAYSRKIVGWCLHDTLEMEGCLKALKQAMRGLPEGFNHEQLIHHSDQGVQYCCKAYTGVLKHRGVQISMAAQGNCYENAQAERLNGILKQEYGLGEVIKTKELARQICRQAIELYNGRRPHHSLDLHLPNEVHAGLEVKVRMSWTKKKPEEQPKKSAA